MVWKGQFPPKPPRFPLILLSLRHVKDKSRAEHGEPKRPGFLIWQSHLFFATREREKEGSQLSKDFCNMGFNLRPWRRHRFLPLRGRRKGQRKRARLGITRPRLVAKAPWFLPGNHLVILGSAAADPHPPRSLSGSFCRLEACPWRSHICIHVNENAASGLLIRRRRT